MANLTAESTLERHHAHHFESAETQFEAAKQGMWIFLATEVLMFGGLFVAFIIFRGLYLDAFKEAHHMLDVRLGLLNTIVLISSSLTMVLAVGAAQRGQKDRILRYLAVTFLLSCVFLVVKYFEYSHKFHDGLLPAGFFTNKELTNPKAPLFFSMYFMMTGLHGIHVLVGMGLMTWLMRRAARGEFRSGYYTPVELVGFYWHFVDMVWIYLFPLLYLIS